MLSVLAASPPEASASDFILRPLVVGEGFAGSVRDLRVYDMSLPSESLAIADDVPAAAKVYYHFYSENDAWRQLAVDQAERAEAARRAGHRVYAHGDLVNLDYAGDIQDVHSSIFFRADEGAQWQAAGGELINYCDPFPSSENPEMYLRRLGIWRGRSGAGPFLTPVLRPVAQGSWTHRRDNRPA